MKRLVFYYMTGNHDEGRAPKNHCVKDCSQKVLRGESLKEGELERLAAVL